MRFRTILLDIGMVLVGFDYEPALQEIAQLSGLSRDEVIRRLEANTDITAYEAGRLSTQEFFTRFSSLLELQISLSHFKQIWRGVFYFDGEASRNLFSAQLFRQLKQTYRLVAVSNTNEMQFSHLSQSYPLLNEFDDYVLSYQVNSLKPQRRIYDVALQKARCAAAEALLVDDVVENIEAAEKLGIRGILFVGEEELRRQLERLGVLT
jgi:FMN phosphatase YigB (HAD superfamily)